MFKYLLYAIKSCFYDYNDINASSLQFLACKSRNRKRIREEYKVHKASLRSINYILRLCTSVAKDGKNSLYISTSSHTSQVQSVFGSCYNPLMNDYVKSKLQEKGIRVREYFTYSILEW